MSSGVPQRQGEEPPKQQNAMPGKVIAVFEGGPVNGERVLDIADFDWPMPDVLYVGVEFSRITGISADEKLLDKGPGREIATYEKDRDTAFQVTEGKSAMGVVYALRSIGPADALG